MNKKETLEKYLGKYTGLLGSKGQYRYDNPDNFVVFNSAITDSEGKFIWSGDVDITKEYDNLVKASIDIGEHLYVYNENHQYHGDTTKDENIENAICKVDSNGCTALNDYYELVDGTIKVKKQPEPTEEEKEENRNNIRAEYKPEDYDLLTKVEGCNKDCDLCENDICNEEASYLNYSNFFKTLDKDKSPLGNFWKTVKEEYPEYTTEENWNNLTISKCDYDRLSKMEEYWYRIFHGGYLSEYRIESGLSFHMFNYGPSHFMEDPDWVIEGYIYFRKDKKNED